VICSKHKQQSTEPQKQTPFPDYPWQKVATDLFEWKKITYVLVVDYYSRYTEVCSLRSTTSASVIHKLKTVFACNGIPESLMSDNCPQFSLQEFYNFSKDHGFDHVTSSHRPMEKQNEQ